MLVKLGNPSPVHGPLGAREPLPGPAVTTVVIPDTEDDAGNRLYQVMAGADLDAVKRSLGERPDVTNLPGHEALLVIVHPGGVWANHSAGGKPSWVWSDDEEFARQLGEFFDIPVGEPTDVEATHFTDAGPPGVGPPEPPPEEPPAEQTGAKR